MSDQQRLRDILRPAVESLVPASQQRKLAAMSSAFGADGGLKPDALSSALPNMIVAWYLAGTVATGTNTGAEIELPSTVRITGIRVRAKTAPTSSEFTVRVNEDGAEIDTATIGIGATSGRSTGLNYTASAGGVLTVDVVSAGSAADVTVIVSYTAAS